MSTARNFFSEAEKEQIVNAIRQAELNTSGEIRLHVELHCKEDVLDHAAFIFERLNMHETEQRNGVLFYIAVEDRKLAILGDVGINSAVPQGFWNDIKEDMVTHFKQGSFAQGLAEGILMAGEQLKKYFPYKDDDVNELPDDISFGKDKA